MDSVLEQRSEKHPWLWRGSALFLILTVTVFRILYLAFYSPLDLAPDEAHYWDWSRNLDWSYYSKGPLIAWLIRAGTEVFGSLSLYWTGSEMLAVRMPAVICGAFLLVGFYCLTVQVHRSERLAFLVVVAALTVPIISAGSLLITIDSPFVCCWIWALIAGYEAILHNKRWAWIITGVLVGLGILAKYTMALWLFSVGLFLLFSPAYRSLLFRSGFWIMVGISLLSCVPILWWNWQNDWVTFRHVAVQAGVTTAQKSFSFRWFGPLEYIGGQFGLLLGYWFICWVAAMVVYRPTRTRNDSFRYLWWMSLPTFALFGLVTFRSSGQLNWPVTAYLSGMVLAAGWIYQQITHPAQGYRRLAQVSLGFTCLLGITLNGIVHDSRFAHPVMAQLLGPPTDTNPFPLRKLDPTCRLRGWHYLAIQVDQLREQIRQEEGQEPILAGLNWMLPGQVGFYCEGHPKVYSFGLRMGDRHSQYDLWRPNPLEDAQVYQGRTFLFVGIGIPKLEEAFEKVSQPKTVIYTENGHPLAGWSIWICRGFKGFPPVESQKNNLRF